ncbi:MAG: hypothetical protein HC828_09130 [Blastochloris sp.]|nr:hypothetical protein [Blastochloris sp.]
MMFNRQPGGLFFTPASIVAAKQASDQEPYASAYQYLRGHEQSGAAAAAWGAFRHCFANNENAAQFGLEMLLYHTEAAVDADQRMTDALAESLSLAQAYEMLRTHPAFTSEMQARWREHFEARVMHLRDRAADGTFTDGLWWSALAVGAGIVLEREPLFQQGVARFQQAVESDIRPQGHIRQAVEGEDGGSMERTLRR